MSGGPRGSEWSAIVRKENARTSKYKRLGKALMNVYNQQILDGKKGARIPKAMD